MMNIHVTLAVMLTIAVFHAGFAALEGESHRVVKRRVKPKITKPLTLNELEIECTHNGWEGCATKARTLLDQRSEENRDFSQCLIDAKQTREQNINLQLGDLLDNDQVGSTLNKKGSEDLNENGDSKDNKVVIAEPPCTINKTQKDYARGQYCNVFVTVSVLFVHNIMESDLVNRGLRDLAHCVDFNADPGYFTPQELLTTLEVWLKNMKSRHKCCTDLNKHFAELPEHTARELNILPQCPPKVNATNEWNNLLSKQARYMKAVDNLKSLGRIKKCLRGCVGEEEVKCVRL